MLIQRLWSRCCQNCNITSILQLLRFVISLSGQKATLFPTVVWKITTYSFSTMPVDEKNHLHSPRGSNRRPLLSSEGGRAFSIWSKEILLARQEIIGPFQLTVVFTTLNVGVFNNPHRKHLLATTSHHRLNWLRMGMRSSGTFVGNNGSGMCLPQLIDWRVESSHLFFSSKDFADASWNSSIGYFPVHVMSGSNKWTHACRYLRMGSVLHSKFNMPACSSTSASSDLEGCLSSWSYDGFCSWCPLP